MRERPGPLAALAIAASCSRHRAPSLAAAAAVVLLALAAVALLGPASADARRVRAFAVGPKFDLR